MAKAKEHVLQSLAQVKFVGQPRAVKIYDQLGVRSLEDLVKAAQGKKLRAISGIGPKVEAQILTAAQDALGAQAPVAAKKSKKPASQKNSAPKKKSPTKAKPPQKAPKSKKAPKSSPASTKAKPEAFSLLDVLICPNCGHDQFNEEAQSLTCKACRSDYSTYLGIVELTPPYNTGGLAQRLMTTKFYSRFYEGFMRPKLTRIVTTRTMEEEYALASNLLELSGESRLLDVACGTGNFTRYFAQSIDAALPPQSTEAPVVVGLDISHSMLEMAQFYAAQESLHQRVSFVLGDAARLPFKRGAFNRLHCAGAFYLMDDVDEVLRNFAYVLEPGGTCVITTYVLGDGTVKRWVKKMTGRPASFQWFDQRELRQRLRRVGLDVVHSDQQGDALTLKAKRV